MWRTRVGYAGGTAPGPTYRSIGDHTETLEVDYDPRIISFTELLEIFWASHRPVRPSFSRQYASLIFYRTDLERRLAQDSSAWAATGYGTAPATEILPYSGFNLAEDYHQKYRLQSAPDLALEMRAVYPETGPFTDSTAAAKINGWLGGNGRMADLRRDLDRLGLSPGAGRLLVSLATRVGVM